MFSLLYVEFFFSAHLLIMSVVGN